MFGIYTLTKKSVESLYSNNKIAVGFFHTETIQWYSQMGKHLQSGTSKSPSFMLKFFGSHWF